MAGTWFCYECQENIGDNEYCPYCGTHRFGKDFVMDENGAKSILKKFFGSKPKKEKQPIFSEEECFLYGIHPKDEMYRKTMELDILSKNYKA